MFGPSVRYESTVGVTKLSTLQILQNRSARTKRRFDTPAMALIRSLNLPAVNNIIRNLTAITVYELLSGLVPEHLSNLSEKKLAGNLRNREILTLIFRCSYGRLIAG